MILTFKDWSHFISRYLRILFNGLLLGQLLSFQCNGFCNICLSYNSFNSSSFLVNILLDLPWFVLTNIKKSFNVWIMKDVLLYECLHQIVLNVISRRSIKNNPYLRNWFSWDKYWDCFFFFNRFTYTGVDAIFGYMFCY